MAKRPPLPERVQHLEHARHGRPLGNRPRNAVGHPPWRLLHRQPEDQGDHDAGHAREGKRHTPTEVLVAPAAEGGAERRADRHAQGVDRECGAPSALRKVVRDERVRRRAASSLANRRADARGEQHRVVHGHAEDGGHGAPGRDGERQDVAPARAVGPRGDRDAHERVEQGERDAGQHTHLKVAGAEVPLDGLERRRQDLRTIHGVEHVTQREGAEHVVRVPGLQERRVGVRRRCGLQHSSPIGGA